jgi:hypothetical protein
MDVHDDFGLPPPPPVPIDDPPSLPIPPAHELPVETPASPSSNLRRSVEFSPVQLLKVRISRFSFFFFLLYNNIEREEKEKSPPLNDLQLTRLILCFFFSFLSASSNREVRQVEQRSWN